MKKGQKMDLSYKTPLISTTLTAVFAASLGFYACSKKDASEEKTLPKIPLEPQLVDDSFDAGPTKKPKAKSGVDDSLAAKPADDGDLDIPDQIDPIVEPKGEPGPPGGEPKDVPPPPPAPPTPTPAPAPKEDVPTPGEMENKLNYEDYCRWVKTDAGQKEAIEKLKAQGLKDEEIKGWLIDINNTVNAVIVALSKKQPSEPGYLDPKSLSGVTSDQLCSLTMSALNEAITLVLDAGDSRIVNPDPISGKELVLEYLFLDGHKISRIGFLRNVTTLKELHLKKNYIDNFGKNQAGEYVLFNIKKDKQGKVVEDRGLYNLQVLSIDSQWKKEDPNQPSGSALPEPIAQYADAKLESISQLNIEQAKAHPGHTPGRALVRINNDKNLLAPKSFRGLRQEFVLSNTSYLMFTKGDFSSCNVGTNDDTRYPKKIEAERASRC